MIIAKQKLDRILPLDTYPESPSGPEYLQLKII